MVSRELIATFPHAPGIYMMRDASGTILYVGKARDLRKRVASYFREAGDGRLQIRFLMERTSSMDYLVTDTEKEALILENTLIKRHRPRYNLNLRDDKTYFSLRIDLREEWPRITVVRAVERDGARYFGPYSSAGAAREVLKHLLRLFPLRHYPLASCRKRDRPCLYHQIQQCAAPCHGLITTEAYADLVRSAVLFLEGKSREVENLFRSRMTAAAAAEQYEEAARYRDLLSAMEVTLEKQKMVSREGEYDLIGIARREEEFTLALLYVRGGALVGSRVFPLRWELSDEEGIAAFLTQYYDGDVTIPPEILLPEQLPESEALVEFLSERRGGMVRLLVPRRGPRRELVELAATNAESALAEGKRERDGRECLLHDLQRSLHLPRLPRRIECYDISLFQGGEAVGSRVVFSDGIADKTSYRRYRIKTVSGTDDFGMLREVFSRRFGGENPDPEPDLIVVDGGIGQLNVLLSLLDELGRGSLPSASLAKSRVERGSRDTEIVRSSERVFLPGRKNPVLLRQNSAPLLLLARIRDEAHRFAVSYHRSLRDKRTLLSELDAVSGVGRVLRTALLKAFGSVSGIRTASRDALEGIPGVSRQLAERIQRELGKVPEGAD